MRYNTDNKIGHADELLPMPIVNQVTTSQNKENLEKSVLSFELTHKIGNLFEWKGSLAHCISSDFKISARIARRFKRRFPCNFPASTNSPNFVEQIDGRLIHPFVLKKRFFFINQPPIVCDNP